MNEQQLNMKLVKEVEKRPILYNFRLPGYSKRDETDHAWCEISKEVNMSAADCKERWKNLRAVFVRNSKPPKSGAGAKPKKAYYLFDAMQFTVPYIKALGAPSGNLESPPELPQQDKKIDYGNNGQPIFEKPPSSQSPISSSPGLPIRQPVNIGLLSQSTTTENKRGFKKDAVDELFIEYLQNKKRKTTTGYSKEEQKNEGLKMFLLSMMPDLMKMTDEQVRQFKRKSLDLIDSILSTCPLISDESSETSRCTTPSSSQSNDGRQAHQTQIKLNVSERPKLTTPELIKMPSGSGSGSEGSCKANTL